MPKTKKTDLEAIQNDNQEIETLPASEKLTDVDKASALEAEETKIPTATDPPKKKRVSKSKNTVPDSAEEHEQPKSEEKPIKRSLRKTTEVSILTINSGGDVVTQEELDDTLWHEIQNAYRTRKILTGVLGGIERTESGGIVTIVYYKDFRVVIPVSEMMVDLATDNGRGGEMITRQSKVLGNSIGAEIDFVIKGIDAKTRSIVASRKEAMMRKRKLFYFDTDSNGNYRVYEGRIVQARVIAVAEKVVRAEVFGVETAILARDLSHDWLGDARDTYDVGDEILVRVLNVKRNSIEDLSVRVDVKSISGDTNSENLKKCKPQGKYVGKVTDIHKGVVFVRLGIGVNAVAHSCYDNRMPGKKDDVSFAVTRIDKEKNVAVGIITRIIKQNI